MLSCIDTLDAVAVCKTNFMTKNFAYCHLNILWTEPRRSNWEDRAEPRHLQEGGLGQDEVRSVLEAHPVLVPRHPVHLILDSVEDVRILEAEEEGKAECLAHRPAAAGEEVNEGDH